MRRYWIEGLPGVHSLPRIVASFGDCHLKPDRVTCCLIERGHLVEYFIHPITQKRAVTLFFGPGELLMRCYPAFSRIEALDDVSLTPFTYRDIFRTLRAFPEAAAQYKHSKALYEEKVEHRLELVWARSDQESFDLMRRRQPWVLSKAPEALIAEYLRITVKRLQELRRE